MVWIFGSLRDRERAMRYEDKIIKEKDERWTKICSLEKKRQGWTNGYRIERRKFYNRYDEVKW